MCSFRVENLFVCLVYTNVTGVSGKYICAVFIIGSVKARDVWHNNAQTQALSLAVRNPDTDPRVVEFLLSELERRSCKKHPFEAEVNRRHFGRTLKMKLLRKSCLFLRRFQLAKSQVVVAIAEDEGRTALHQAARRGDAKLYRMLLKTGADPHKKTLLGVSPSDILENRGESSQEGLFSPRRLTVSMMGRLTRTFRYQPDTDA